MSRNRSIEEYRCTSRTVGEDTLSLTIAPPRHALRGSARIAHRSGSIDALLGRVLLTSIASSERLAALQLRQIEDRFFADRSLDRRPAIHPFDKANDGWSVAKLAPANCAQLSTANREASATLKSSRRYSLRSNCCSTRANLKSTTKGRSFTLPRPLLRSQSANQLSLRRAKSIFSLTVTSQNAHSSTA